MENECKCASPVSCADRNMHVILSAGPVRWSLLLLCVAGFCSQLVATGNQSSRGQMGRCQTQPDQCQSPRGSLGLLVTGPGARVTVSARKPGRNDGQRAQCPFTLLCMYLFFNQFGMKMEKFPFLCLSWINGLNNPLILQTAAPETFLERHFCLRF